MRLSELSQHQAEVFEGPRGIVNHDDNLDRALDEWQEAKEEHDPLKRLEEMVDMIIVLTGGMGRIVQREGLDYSYLDDLLKRKLELNLIKYDQETFDCNSPQTAAYMVRHYWKVNPDDWEVDGDYY